MTEEAAALPLILKDLRLPTVGRLWEAMGKQAIEEGWSPIQYLRALCEHERNDRLQKRMARHLLEAQLPRGKGLESFDFKAVPKLNRSQITGLGRGEGWIEEGKNILIFGPSGVGKTHLASGIGEKLVESGYRVFFTRTTELLQKLEAAKRDFNLPSRLDRLDKYDCLILDDFGYVQRTGSETNLLFELICERYERRSLMITCNQTFKEWDSIFEDKQMAIAATDRLVHHAILFEMNTESYRKKEALGKRKGGV